MAKLLPRRSISSIESLDSIDLFEASFIFHDFAKRVAQAREHRAQACWEAEAEAAINVTANGIDCTALCAINVTATELELIRSASPAEGCSPDSIPR